MPRRRLGVVLLVPPPVDREVDGLRRACAPELVDRIAAHLTLVPPVNVHEDDLDDALATVADVASTAGPLRLGLGPVATFHPVTPVLYLAAAELDADLDAEQEGTLARLHHDLLAGPLARRIDHAFVPHVTLADELPPERIEAALSALGDYRTEVTAREVTVLEERRDESGQRVWRPLARLALGRRAVVGRGGRELVLDESSLPGPAVDRFLEGPEAALPAAREDRRRRSALVVTARHAGRLVGVAEGRVDPDGASLDLVVVDPAERSAGVGATLLARMEDGARHRGAEAIGAEVPEGDAATFLDRHGWRRVGSHLDRVVLRRTL